MTHAFRTFWVGEPTDVTRLGFPIMPLMAVAGIVAVAGLRRHLRSVDPPRRRATWIVVWALVATVLGGVVSQVAGGIGGLTPGRYWYAALGPVAVAYTVGLATMAEGSARGRRVLAAAVGTGLVLALASTTLTLTGARSARHEGAGAPRQAVPVSAVDAAAEGPGGSRFAVEAVAVDEDRERVHVRVRVTGGDQAVEWTPIPRLLLSSGAGYAASHQRSDRLPELVGAGATADGWFRIPVRLLEDALPRRRAWVVFEDVATVPGYRQMSDVVVPIDLPPLTTAVAG
jgi:hypothetical protein